ncbi:MAG: response regulator transcription factor [Bacteroidia bacterium]
MKISVLLVEDEKMLSESISTYLINSGLSCEVASTYQESLEKISRNNYDCIIIDINLPDGSGIELIKHIKRKKLESGLIIISARNTLEDKIEGLDTGADDFLTKPFHLSELNARINALIRRKKFSGNNILEYNEISVDPETQTVKVNEKTVSLTKKEFELLVYFISNTGKIITKDAIAFSLWRNNSDLAVSSEIIYTHLKNMRKKLVEAGATDYISAIYGVGYKFGK